MIEQLKTIRAGLETATCYSMLGVDAHSVQIAITALTQIEAMVGEQEPVAKLHDDGYWTPMKTEAGRALNDRLICAGSPPIDVYAAPVAQQYEAGDVASASAQGFRDGVAGTQPLLNEAIDRINDMLKDDDGQAYKEARKFVDRVAQQPQARPDFTDEWNGYLKDGETPFERFLRERKDLQSLLKLYQRVLEENERLNGQQPQAETDNHEARGQIEFLDKKNNALLAAIRKVMARLADLLDEDQFKEIEETISSAGVQPQAEAVHRYVLELPDGDKREVKIYWIERQETAGEITHRLCIAVDAAPQQAEAVPPGYVLVPVEPTQEMCDAAVQAVFYGPEGGFTRISGPRRTWRAMLDAAIAQQKGGQP